MRFTTFAILLCTVAACAPQPIAPPSKILTELPPLERVAIERNWRDAARLSPENGAVSIDLGMTPRDAVLRLGVLPPEDSSAVGVTVLLDGEPLRSRQLTGPRAWHDLRFAIASVAQGQQCRVDFSATKPFWVAPCEWAVPRPDKPNVIIFLMDAVRLDHLSLYGYERATTPNIDAFAADATVFTQLVPASSWTRPSVASLWTGVYPETHGAQDSEDIMRGGMPSLARALARQGYETHAIMSNFNCLPEWGFGDDFAFFDFVPPAREDNAVVDQALEIIEHAQDRPCFLYMHLMGPHGPYRPPSPEFFSRFQPQDKALTSEAIKALLAQCPDTEPFNQIRQVLGPEMQKTIAGPDAQAPVSIDALRQLCVDLYDGDIAFTDAQFARLVDALKESGRFENTLVIVTADHGEEFWEHGGYRHGRTLHEEQLRIPLAVRLPQGKAAGTTRTGLVNMVDIAPTLLDFLGAQAEEGFQGTSFLPLLLADEGDSRPGYASLYRANSDINLRVAKTPAWKYVHDVRQQCEYWHDLIADPAEGRPLEASPENGGVLRRHAQNLGTKGATGLYILITCDLGQGHRVTGSLNAPGLGEVELRFPPRFATLSPRADGLDFELLMNKQPGLPDDRQDYQALFLVPLGMEDELRATVQLDGRNAQEHEVFLGPEREPGALGASIAMRDLVAGPDALNLAHLPRQFGAYLWYVPAAQQMNMDDLAKDAVDSLEALGYLNGDSAPRVESSVDRAPCPR